MLSDLKIDAVESLLTAIEKVHPPDTDLCRFAHVELDNREKISTERLGAGIVWSPVENIQLRLRPGERRVNYSQLVTARSCH